MKNKTKSIIHKKNKANVVVQDTASKSVNFKRLMALLCIGVLSIVADSYWIFERHHLVAIIIGLVACVALLYGAFHDAVISYWSFVLLSIAALVFSGGFIYYVGPNLPEETATHGWLYPANDRVPTTNCAADHPGTMFILGGSIAKIDDTIQRVILLQVEKTPLIAVERSGDRLLFDAYIYKKDGVIAAKIDRGEFRLNPKAIFYGEHANNSPSDLTVYGDNNQELLRIYYANPSTVFIRGVFYSEDGTQAIITNDSISVATKGPKMTFSKNCFHNSGLGVSQNGVSFANPLPKALQ
jgi:hypothetical protein